ncbi:hypothetical protein [Burkholderia gladioli]|uniref:hypothetical protein n=1 Tax=Burkholderia gladioli TaxID=28095 RepID=UPI001640E3F9|nr:hypothetical protein [Burkholderia gladioli]
MKLRELRTRLLEKPLEVPAPLRVAPKHINSALAIKVAAIAVSTERLVDAVRVSSDEVPLLP